MCEVSELLMVANGTITALVEKLEADGFIHREVNSETAAPSACAYRRKAPGNSAEMARRHGEG